jgi:hypothetical protein
MKNIHILPTNKPSRLFKDDFGKYFVSINIDQEQNHFKPQNIYITNDLEIKEGDWYIHKQINYLRVSNSTAIPMDAKKIILTDNKDLIKDGVQAIDDEFLEWFVNNPSCEEVEVDKGYRGVNLFNYKIIIPQEEPKQETLEEAAERILLGEDLDLSDYDKRHILKAMLSIAKWKQEQDKKMYSEEDLREAFRQGQDNMDYSDTYGWDSKLTEQDWFEQFSKLKKN